MIRKLNWQSFIILALVLVASIPVQAEEDYEQFAAAQTKAQAEKIKPYEQEVLQLKASVEKRLQSGDVANYASTLRAQQYSQEQPTVKRYPEILVFVSFSMPQTSLKQWLNQIEKVKGNLVIRGLLNNSFKETSAKLVKLFNHQPGGLLLDPTLFQRYQIEKVPAVVVHESKTCQANQSCMEDYAVFYGDTNLEYALTQIAAREPSLAPMVTQAVTNLRGKG